MPSVARKGDLCTGHGSYPPRPNKEGSPDVYVNGQPIHRIGDRWNTHGHTPPPDDDKLVEGSTTVFANGIGVGRIGDEITDKARVAQGSPNVFVGDSPPSIQLEGGVFVYTDSFAYSLRASRKLVTQAGTNAILDTPEEEPLKANLENEGFPEEEPVTEPIEEVHAEDKETPELSEECPIIEGEVDYDTPLSPNTTIRTFTLSPVFPHPLRAQRGLSLSELVCNMKHLAINVYEPLMAAFPELNLNSGFRRGESGSQHCIAQACDLQAPGKGAAYYREVLNFIAENIPYDQCIIESSNGGQSYWVHVSYDRNKTQQRKERLTYFAGRSPAYTSGWEITA